MTFWRVPVDSFCTSKPQTKALVPWLERLSRLLFPISSGDVSSGERVQLPSPTPLKRAMEIIIRKFSIKILKYFHSQREPLPDPLPTVMSLSTNGALFKR